MIAKRNRMLSQSVVGILILMFSSTSFAQISHVEVRPLASNIIVPQSRDRAFCIERREGPVQITEVIGLVDIVDQVAVTTVEIRLKNPSRRRQEAELIMPVPDGAVIRGFTFQGAGKEPSAQVLPKEEAKKIYNRLVAKIKDPALLEFAGYNLVRSSVFPVEANGTQKVRLTYEHILPIDGNRIDYILPRSEMLDYKVPWKVSVKIKSARPIATVYSPSHKIITTKLDLRSAHNVSFPGAITMTVKIAEEDQKNPGSFRFSILMQENDVTATMLCYPDPKVGGGYFLLLGGLPPELAKKNQDAIQREITLVIDRSGSMNGEKIEQAREAALQIIAGLNDGEKFNIVIYNNTVEMFSAKPVVKNDKNEKAARQYVKGIRATGGTNIHDALLETLRQKPTEDTLPIVLFLTDGLPTVGNTSEVAIRNVAMKSNPHKRRIFTFGVGVDVNAPLLEKIADETRAKATFVLPKEDVEVKVSQVFRRLSGPILAEPVLEIRTAKGKPAVGRTRDIIPAILPDLYDGDQFVLLGQYVGEDPVTFLLRGNFLGKKKTFKFKFKFNKATTKNSFVPRLWASRKIAELIDAIRQMGADNKVAKNDPRVKELVDEIVRLSTEFGILTEYTAFLAKEGTDLSNEVAVREEAQTYMYERAVRSRSGWGGVNQSFNLSSQKGQSKLNRDNYYYDAKMNRVSIATVQQVNDLAFYRRGNRWVDSRLVNQKSQAEPQRVVQFGSDEFKQLASRLAKENRQGSVALRGEVMLEVDGEAILIRDK